MFESFFNPGVSPEYQAQLDSLAESLAVRGINRVALENSLYRAVDHGDMSPDEVQQTLGDYCEAFKVD